MDENKNQNPGQEPLPDLTKQENPLEAAPVASTPDAVPSTTSQVSSTSPKATPKLRQRLVRRIGPGFYVGCLGFIVFLFVLLVSLLVLFGGVDPTLFEAFNIPTEQVPTILSGLVNTTFGLLTLIIFVGLLGAGLQLALLKKSDKNRRKPLIYSMIFAGMCLILVLPAWFVVASSIRLAKPVDASLPVIQVWARSGDKEQFEQLQSYSDIQAPIELRFSAAGAQEQYPGYRILNYEWDLDGDGFYIEGKTGTEVVWKYEDKGDNNGLYDVTLKMTMQALPGNQNVPAGERREFTSKVAITISSVVPTPVLVTKPETTEGVAPFKVDFDASGSYDGDSEELEYFWNFDVDGDNLYNDAKGEKTTFTFEEPGEYDVSLRVQDLEGHTTTIEKKVTVNSAESDEPHAAILASPNQGEAPLRVAFDGTESSSPSGPITKYLWNFGDGTLDDGAIINHTFQKGGTYQVKLTVTDIKDKQAESAMTITVTGQTFAPKINVTSNPSMTYDRVGQEFVIDGGVPLTVAFDASGTTDQDRDVIAYEWDFDGDGTFDETGAKVSHRFSTGGTTIVRARVRDSAGNSDEMTIKIRQEQVNLEARMQVTPLSGTAPLRVSFDASPSTYLGGTIEAYNWDFGDGSTPRNADAQVTYTYRTVGTYTAKLTVLTNDGKEASTTQRIIVKEVPLKAAFVPSVKAGKAPLTVDFDASGTTGNAEQFIWDFGDGGSSTRKNPSHTFQQKGSYEVTLRVLSGDGIEDEYSETITVL